MKIIKENEYFQVGATIFQYLVIDGKHKLIPTKKVVKKEFVPPDIEQVKAYFKVKGYNEESAVKFYDYYNPEWKDSNGKPVKNWEQKARGIWFKEENKIKTPSLSTPKEGIKFFQ